MKENKSRAIKGSNIPPQHSKYKLREMLRKTAVLSGYNLNEENHK